MKAINRGVANARDWKPEENLPLAVDALRAARTVLITMHRGPDGDALGSALALASALRDLGREVTVYNPDDLPYNFRFLRGAAEVAKSLPAGAAFDVTVAADAGAFDRLGPDVPRADRRGVLLNLDHHITTEPFGDVNYVDPHAASVGILAYKIIRALGGPFSKDTAECVYASILADTGCFRYSSTDPECLRIAAELVEAGVEPWEMTVRVYEQQPLARMRLLAEVLSTLEVHGKLATITITNAMVAKTGSETDLTDGFINFARSVDGVEVAASFREPQDEGPWRVSFRSRGRVNVAAIAQKFGGGGHHNAAGCSIEGDEAKVRARIADEVEEALKNDA
ncbi:MAG: bifunctional oligoribonuclease/PAP phosphatase NrnA [Deltaproteobacteria bacterium]|nr:MAG: bifunctional oligoribonuclease/PAP phosphatase NrnA [Deltaproteobacteria bacterium]TMA74450.1 MAG: bifunctional oligoribonuclease/PAP phosphatase NrnA [Deltaproteobacteria bacterium]TMB36133.1 MAG: bifunctional oligoribonuclease/PAP phosphatase NrnA [Deltaproteobacteria bacterium]